VRNRRSNYLINPKFQLKFTFYVCLLVFISSLVYPMTIYDLLERVIHHLGQVSPKLIDEFKNKQMAIVTVLFLWQLGFTMLVFVISIFFTHKVAGPIYKAMLFLKGVRKGEHWRLKFRDGDHFMELADEINTTIDHLNQEHTESFTHLAEIRDDIKAMPGKLTKEQKTVLDGIEEKLSKII
jgi:hypothetical protein